MGQKMTWEEMKKAYPDELLLVTGYELDELGEIVTGVVERHAKDGRGIDYSLATKQGLACYTGEILTGFKGYIRRCQLMNRKPLL